MSVRLSVRKDKEVARKNGAPCYGEIGKVNTLGCTHWQPEERYSNMKRHKYDLKK